MAWENIDFTMVFKFAANTQMVDVDVVFDSFVLVIEWVANIPTWRYRQSHVVFGETGR